MGLESCSPGASGAWNRPLECSCLPSPEFREHLFFGWETREPTKILSCGPQDVQQ